MMDHRREMLASVLLTLVLGCVAGADLTTRLNSIFGRSSQSTVRMSVRVLEAESGRELYSRNSRTPLTPASNMKLIVSAAILHYLGPDYEYSTVAGLSGDKLVVLGSGDPVLCDAKTDERYGRADGWLFADIAAVLKARGISSLSGIIVDTSIFDQQRVHPNWSASELNRWYACEVSGLNFADNCIVARARKTSAGVEVSIEPDTRFIEIRNKVEAITSGEGVLGSYRTNTPNQIVIHGKCRTEVGPIDIAIEQPALLFGNVLAEKLVRNGIAVSGPVKEDVYGYDGDIEPLAVYVTPLSDVLRRCNKDSLGLAAEAMIKTIAAENNPDRLYGSWQRGGELVGDYLKWLGCEESEFVIDDGSGLSRQNKLTTYALSRALLVLYHSPSWDMLKPSLAIGGVDGTISRYFRSEKYEGKVRAKTGYISGVRALSGVCETSSGDYLFSILANRTNGSTRSTMYDMVEAIIDEFDVE